MTAPLGLCRRGLAAGLFLTVALVALLGLGAEACEHVLHWHDAEPMVELLSLSEERNLPTWFSSSLLLGCGVLLLLVAAAARGRGEPDVGRWRLLGVLFLYISFDEAVSIHERMNAWFDGDGVLHFGWILPATVVVCTLGLVYLPFLRRLPAASRRRFVVAGAFYVGGALLMELPLGWWTTEHGSGNFGWVLIDFVEETAEMVGASLFLLALVDHLVGSERRVAVELTGEPLSPGEPPARGVLQAADAEPTGATRACVARWLQVPRIPVGRP